jgi:type IX secretion system PorP/SprF family membrane protein
MKNLRFCLCLFFICFLKIELCNAQDPSFSQIDNTLSYYHASNINLEGGAGINMAHRRQWSKVLGGFTTTWINGTIKAEKKNTSFGFNFISDLEGAALIQTQKIEIVCRQQLKIRSIRFRSIKSFTIGGYAGVERKSIDWSKLVFSDQIDPVFGIYQPSSQLQPQIENTLFYDCGISLTTSLSFKANNLRIPINIHTSVNHFISRGDESLQGIETQKPRLFVISATSTIQKNDFFNTPLIKPSFQWELQTKAHRIKFGSLAGYISERAERAFYVGMYYSTFVNFRYRINASAIIPVVGFEKQINNSVFSFGYSYDMILSGLNVSQAGGIHEITMALSYVTKKTRYKQGSNVFVKCPDF